MRRFRLMSKLAAYAFGLCLLPRSADNVMAQEGDKPFNGLQEVEFVLFHRVDDDCWPRPQETKAAVEKLLLQAGLNTSETGTDTGVAFYLSTLGGAVWTSEGKQLGCTAVAKLDIGFADPVLPPWKRANLSGEGSNALNYDWFFVESYEDMKLIGSSDGDSFQQRITYAFEEMTNDFLEMWLEDNPRYDYPNQTLRPSTIEHRRGGQLELEVTSVAD